MTSALSAARSATVAIALFAAVAATALVLFLFWPAGVAMGLAVGIAAVLAIGAGMQASERAHPADEDLAARLGILDDPTREVEPVAVRTTAEPEPVPALHAQGDVLYFTSDDDPDRAEARIVTADPVRVDLEQLKAELGEEYRDFARAARLVVSTQYASAARLQRDLDLPYSRARRLLADLEQQHFIGPATGSLPRQVLLPKDRLPEVERLLAQV